MNVLELKKIRDFLGISREEMAEKIGVTKDTLSNWEYRTKEIPKDKENSIKYVFDTYFENFSDNSIKIKNKGDKNNFFADENSNQYGIAELLEIIKKKDEQIDALIGLLKDKNK